MLSMLKQLWKDEEGPTAVEYALMVALIAAVIVGAVRGLGNQTSTTFDTARQNLGGAANP